jgi:hypothetical protein
MKILPIIFATVLVCSFGCTGTHQRSEAGEYKVIQRYDYPGLNTNRDFSTFYAFPWQTQLSLYEQQGWSIDLVAFTTNGMGVEALITLKHAKK